MAVGHDLKYADLAELYCDPMNPRLGRHLMDTSTSQDDLLDHMKDWTLDELALSYLENDGFWSQEALLVVEENLYDEPHLVVVEGNRRLAALHFLKEAYEGNPLSKKWDDMTKDHPEPPNDLFEKIPYLLADNRRDVESFLGFRHVTGIKQWDAAEKAGFIAKLIDVDGMSYDEVRKRIGSKTPTVRKLYIAYRLLLQIEDTVESYNPELTENRFTILNMSLNSEGTREFLGININADPHEAESPVPRGKHANLVDFSNWLFGPDEETPPLVRDTRYVTEFGKILSNAEAVAYLRKTSKPKLEVAYRIAGGDEQQVVSLVDEASDNIELALTRLHFYKSSKDLQKSIRRMGINALQAISLFPEIQNDIQKES